MHPSLTRTLNSSLVRKVGAVLIGVTLWSLVNTLHEATLTVEVPLCFFNLEDNLLLSAPEKVQVILSGSRSNLRALDLTTLAAHVDASKILRRGGVILNAKHLLLPRSIKLVSYNPINLTVSVQKKTAGILPAPETGVTVAGETIKG